MIQTKNIKHFFFDSAVYHVSDGKEDIVILRVNYARNYFSIEDVGTGYNKAFRKELSDFARDLLMRKHKTDFASK